MKVLIVSQYFWPESFRINDLAQGLVERGHEVTVLTGKPNYPNGSFFSGYGFFRPVRDEYEGVKIFRVPLIPRGGGGRVRLTLNYLSFVFFASILGPVLSRGEFDLIFVFEPSPVTVGLPAIVLKKLKRLPLMFWVQDLWPESLSATGAVSSKLLLGWVETMVRYIYRQCDRVLVQSRGFTPRVVELGARSDEVVYFPNWAESLYRPVEAESAVSERDRLPDGFRVMFAGNVGAAQSFSTILEAAERLKNYPEIQWVILGDGRMKPWVEKRIRELGLQKSFHLLGHWPVETMPRYFSLADLLLVTLRDDDIFSLTIPGKVQSYLACGRPIVAALDGEGARVIREAGAGLVAPAQDAKGLAEAVLKMYRTSEEERESMGRRGREYFERHFEREMLLDRLEQLMAELVADDRKKNA